MKNQKRIKDKESGSFLDLFRTFAYTVKTKDGTYTLWASSMLDACDKAWRLTDETDSYINEQKYVRVIFDSKGNLIHKPFWWEGRVYKHER